MCLIPNQSKGARNKMIHTDEDFKQLKESLRIARTNATFYQGQYFKSVLELQNANKGIKRLRRKLDRIGYTKSASLEPLPQGTYKLNLEVVENRKLEVDTKSKPFKYEPNSL